MASNYTANYGLCQWEAADSFIRTEFNQDNAKIDAALKDLEDSKAEQTDLDALTTTVAGKADQADLDALSDAVEGKASQTDYQDLLNAVIDRAVLRVGTYTGNGALSQRVPVGLIPSVVIVERADGLRCSQATGAVWGGMALQDHPLCRGGAQVIELSGSSFYAYNQGAPGDMNEEGVTYYYLAMR